MGYVDEILSTAPGGVALPVLFVSANDKSVHGAEYSGLDGSVQVVNCTAPGSSDPCALQGYPKTVIGSRVFIDFKGSQARLDLRTPLILQDLVLYNLAPGGVHPPGTPKYNILGKLVAPPPPLTGPDAHWANSSLPLWYLTYDRRGHAAIAAAFTATVAAVAATVTAVTATFAADTAAVAAVTATVTAVTATFAADTAAVAAVTATVADDTATPLSYDPSSGTLVLAVARHYGWEGTNVTINPRLPDDAPPSARILPYPDLVLPYSELADMDISRPVDFVSRRHSPPQPSQPLQPPLETNPDGSPTPSSGAPRNHSISAPPPETHAPSHITSGRRNSWAVPLAAALSAAGGTLLIAVAAVVVRRQLRGHWRQQSDQYLEAAGKGGGRAGSESQGTTKSDRLWSAVCNVEAGGSALDSRVVVASGKEGRKQQQDGLQAKSLPKSDGNSSNTTNLALALQQVCRSAVSRALETVHADAGGGAEQEEPRSRAGRHRLAAATAASEVDYGSGFADEEFLRIVAAELQEWDLEVQGVLGRGSSGVVYLGTWRGLSVAVKMLVVPDAAAAEGRAHQRAALEAAISMSMGHPNVVATYTYQLKQLVHKQQSEVDSQALESGGTTGQSAGPSQVASDGKAVVEMGGDAYKLYIVQELCNGGTLRQALAQGVAGSVRAGGPARALALRLALDVAQGMRHVHGSRIVHGDLKPDNVLLGYKADEGGLLETGPGLTSAMAAGSGGGGDDAVPLVAKVADFGLSLPLAEGATHASHRFQGTPAYAAPEDMLATSQHYGRLALDCLLVDVRARPDFATITARLLEARDSSCDNDSETLIPDGLKDDRPVWLA
ncbi:hypothetical protein GPECTOR_15g352 [Gonium pectorale]|uniref:Protein kinase domain-containing protein n=1 Tax=Gonium pectorale TaxID=33097 RepID=A0A150GLL3_GONPE|nr:hypothetical protein GPECTOR_15g352 [Gonium pectorale]|eukprot:KXZ50668.1 hypothetical protein GPECTOR_15g352 [Gonium pectorale]